MDSCGTVCTVCRDDLTPKNMKDEWFSWQCKEQECVKANFQPLYCEDCVKQTKEKCDEGIAEFACPGCHEKYRMTRGREGKGKSNFETFYKKLTQNDKLHLLNKIEKEKMDEADRKGADMASTGVVGQEYQKEMERAMQAAIKEEEKQARYIIDAELARRFQEEEAEMEAMRKSGVGDALDPASAALIEQIKKELQAKTDDEKTQEEQRDRECAQRLHDELNKRESSGLQAAEVRVAEVRVKEKRRGKMMKRNNATDEMQLTDGGEGNGSKRSKVRGAANVRGEDGIGEEQHVQGQAATWATSDYVTSSPPGCKPEEYQNINSKASGSSSGNHVQTAPLNFARKSQSQLRGQVQGQVQVQAQGQGQGGQKEHGGPSPRREADDDDSHIKVDDSEMVVINLD